MKNLLTGTLLLAVFVAQLGAQSAAPAPEQGSGVGISTTKPGCGMSFGTSYIFQYCAPKGWTLDNSTEYLPGASTSIYPDGSNWDSAKQTGTIMYITTFNKPNDKYTVEKGMAFDARDTKKSSKFPGLIVKRGEPIKLGDLSVPVQLFAPGPFYRYEASAYIDSPRVIIMFVMSSKNEDTFKRDFPAFVQFVQSYTFMSSNVTIEHK